MLKQILNITEKIVIWSFVLLAWLVLSCELSLVLHLVAYALFGPNNINPTVWSDWRWCLFIAIPMVGFGIRKLRTLV